MAVECKTAFPYRQLCVLAVCRICEPIAFMSIFPYIYYMVQWFGIARNEREIALYAGMVTSAFALAEFMAGVPWGRLSDKIGRKPVLLCGLAGTGISMVLFGFAKNLPMALVARALGGLLNGNIGVLQTTVAELVTVEAHKARAFSIMPFVWCLGAIIGAGLGGTLADPVKNYPTVFSHDSIFAQYPFLLPNLVCAVVVIFSLTVGILFLEETHEDKKSQRDPGLTLGRWLLRRDHPALSDEKDALAEADYLEETLSLLVSEDDLLPPYESTSTSPQLTASAAPASMPDVEALDQHLATEKAQTACISAFTNQVWLNIIGFGVLAFHTITFEQLLPILLSLPKSSVPIRLPFHFTGGLELSAKDVGYLLSAQGIMQMIIQLFVFPAINNRFGSLTTFRFVIFLYPLLYFLTPYLAILPVHLQRPCIYLVLLGKVTAQALSYPSSAIMLATMAPKGKLGLLNGCAASAASLSRAIGPTLAGFLQTTGLQAHLLALPWLVSGCVALVGMVISTFVVTPKPNEKQLVATNGVTRPIASRAFYFPLSSLFDRLIGGAGHSR